MEPSLWAQYKAEMHGLTVLEVPWGFCAFVEAPDSIFIDEFYVVREQRREGRGKELLEHIKVAAIKSGKQFLTSTVNLSSKTAQVSLAAQLAVGFYVVRANNDSLLLKLDVGSIHG